MELLTALILALQENGNGELKYEDVKTFAQRNIFFPAKPKKEEKKPEKKEEKKEEKKVEKPREPEWPVVTGFEVYPDGARLLVTTRSSNSSQRYKVGDALCGGKIVSIDATKAVVEVATGRIELRNGDPVKDKAAPTTITKIGWVAAAAACLPALSASADTGSPRKRAEDQMEDDEPTPRKKKNRP